MFPGYTSLGYQLRSRAWNGDLEHDALAGQTILVTGASSGIGEAASERLVRLGARVHMLARDAERGAAARDRVAERVAASGANGRGRLELEVCDLSDLDAVRDFAADFAARTPRLGGLLHNAGVLPPRRERSAQGHELAFATNVLGPFLLTNLLLDSLRRGAPSRVVLMSSGGMYTSRLDLDDLELEDRDFDGPRFYAHTKRIQVILAELWAEREREEASPSRPFIRDGSTRPVYGRRSPASTACCVRCYGIPPRAPTPRCGFWRPRPGAPAGRVLA